MRVDKRHTYAVGGAQRDWKGVGNSRKETEVDNGRNETADRG